MFRTTMWPSSGEILTYLMVQSPSWEANWFAASQEIPRISQNPKVHYRTHKRPPPVPILGQTNPVHITTSHLLEIHPNIIHSSRPRSPQWSLSLRFPHQDPIHPPLLTHMRHMPSPSNYIIRRNSCPKHVHIDNILRNKRTKKNIHKRGFIADIIQRWTVNKTYKKIDKSLIYQGTPFSLTKVISKFVSLWSDQSPAL